MRIGILGGAFNPPHNGHLVIAQDILDAFKLGKIFFIPTNISPHKENGGITGEMRLEMVKLAISDNDAFEVLDLEIRRGGTSFTIDTVRELKKRYPEDEFYLIVGSDLANAFSSWKDSQELKQELKIIVANRKEYPLKDKNPYLVVDIRQVEVSSSGVRKLLKEGRSIECLAGKNVVDYIQKHNLYKEFPKEKCQGFNSRI